MQTIRIFWASLFFSTLLLFACSSGGDKSSETPATTGDYVFTLQHDNITRTYGVHVPASYQAIGPKTPVFIYLHGGGGNIQAAYNDGLGQAADRLGFILAIPEGTVIGSDPMASRWNGGTWGGGLYSCCGTADDVGFISRMIDELKLKYNVDEKRIYAAGISNGGLMVNRLACELAGTIAAFATVAPTAVPDNCTPSRPIPVMDIHGTADTCNPFDGSDPAPFCQQDYEKMPWYDVIGIWRPMQGCSASYTGTYSYGAADCISYTGCTTGAAVEFCRVTGMGHTWPSGAQYLPAVMIGPVSYDISTDQMWDFFISHSLP